MLSDSKIRKLRAMNPIEGQIDIDIFPHKDGVLNVHIISNRPLKVSKILVGKKPEQVLAIIPLMYNICGTAHSRAALRCMQQCMRIETDPGMENARDMLLLVETAREHLMRILLDWPKLFAVDAEIQGLAFVNQLTGKFKSALFSGGRAFAFDSQMTIRDEDLKKLIAQLQQYLHEHVFAVSPSAWLANKNMADLLNWSRHTHTITAQAIQAIYTNGWASQGENSCQPLPHFGDEQLHECFDQQDADTFIAEPTWQGHCFETTAFSRQRQHPLIQMLHGEFRNALITRWVARLVELAGIPQQLTDMLDHLKGHETGKVAAQQTRRSVAQVETARGRLIHRVEFEKGLISNYQILAPTEWNFHPQGPLAQALASIRSNDKKELNQLAHLIINAIDPCVGYKLGVH